MKRLSLIMFASVFILTSCDEENENTPFEPAFELSIEGEAPNAEITIVNNTTGATDFTWSFGEGADLEESMLENPTVLTVDKAGTFTVQLTASNGSEEKQVSEEVMIAGNSAIVTYTDIAFGLNAGDEEFGRFFSVSEGEIYLDSEINAQTGPLVDLAFGSLENTLYFFEGPSESDFDIPGAKATEVINFESEPTFTIEEFTAIENASSFDIEIEGTNDSFGNSSIGEDVILFETAEGKVGAIYLKVVNSSRLLVDIKAEKY